jgi:hypothetical protein
MILIFVLLVLSLIMLFFLFPARPEGFIEAPAWDTSTPLIIVSAHFKENLGWLKKSTHPVVVCSKEGASTPEIPGEPRCKLPNFGREASSYLKFIVEFYDALPVRVAFIHGHERAWHQNLDILTAIQSARPDVPYVSLNNMFYDDRTIDNHVYASFIPTWNTHFKPYVKRDLPARIFHDCCAQFIVHRDAIHALPHEAYQHWLDLLKNSKDDYTLGMQIEYVWHIIFGMPDVLESHEQYADLMF